jgi:hypothetical protein
LTAEAAHGALPGRWDDETPDDRILSIEIGGKTVATHLEAAIKAGRVVRRPDGKFELRQPIRQAYIGKRGEFGPCCSFLNDFMFTQVYGEKAVPIGCRDCYKIKVVPDTLRQLMAVKDIAEDFPCSSKSGSEVDKKDTPSLYASYFYFLGLDKARATFRKLRDAVDAHPKLGPMVKMVIKRGCTNYERACGPSDSYTFDPRLAEVEAYFWARFVRRRPGEPRKDYRDAITLMQLVRTAYRIGDDTYKDFTGGKDLFAPTVNYAPDGASSELSNPGDDAAGSGAASGSHSISR